MKKINLQSYAEWLNHWTKGIDQIENLILKEEKKGSDPKVVAILEKERNALYSKLNQSVKWYAQNIANR